jgi:tight adherence protein B
LLLALGAGVCAAVLTVYFLVQALVERRRRAWEERVKYPGDAADSMIVRGPGNKPAGWDEQFDKGFERMVDGAQVGMPPEKVLAVICMVAVVLGGALFLWRGQFWLGVAGGVIGLTVPLIVLAFLQGRARAELQSQLPDFYYLLARSLRAGMNLEQAIELAIAEDLQPLSGELKPLLGHLRLGLPLPQALARVADNIKLLDFHTFVSIVSFYRVNGGNLGMLLDRLGDSVRDRNQFRGHLAATTAQARFTALLIGLAGPMLLAGYAVFQPEHVVPFFQSVWGWALLFGALTLEAVAACVMYQILRIDY